MCVVELSVFYFEWKSFFYVKSVRNFLVFIINVMVYFEPGE